MDALHCLLLEQGIAVMIDFSGGEPDLNGESKLYLRDDDFALSLVIGEIVIPLADYCIDHLLATSTSIHLYALEGFYPTRFIGTLNVLRDNMLMSYGAWKHNRQMLD